MCLRGNAATSSDIALEPVATGERSFSRVSEQVDSGLSDLLNLGDPVRGVPLCETCSVPDVTDEALPILVVSVLLRSVEVRGDGSVNYGGVKRSQRSERVAYPARHLIPRRETNSVDCDRMSGQEFRTTVCVHETRG